MINIFFRILNGINRRFLKLIWRLRLKSVGNNTIFDRGVKIYNPQNISIGRQCVINNGVILQSCEEGQIIIGNNVTISYNAILLTCGLELDNYQNNKVHFSKDIILEDKVWISANVTILPGVKIASGAIVAAGSVVTKNVESGAIVAGVPAKVMKVFDK
jgi:acetyltransferase-like isoleucine patch superfamily enzyme